MESYILFRSRKIRTHLAGESHQIHRGRGTDVSDIGPYILGDDTRDISWQHTARSTDLMKKIRAENDTFPIIVINTLTERDGFFTDEFQMSPYMFAHEIQKHVQISAKKYHFPYRETLIQHIENSMIIILGHDIEGIVYESYLPLAVKNDVILIGVYHPEEKFLTKNRIFGGFGVSSKHYERAFLDAEQSMKYTTQRHGASFLSLSTDADITRELNIFFKKRNPHARTHTPA